MSAAGMGYVGIGLSPGGLMSGSDIIVGWVPSMSRPQMGMVRDYSVNGRVQPTLDAQQDVTFLSSSMLMDGAGAISISFRRQLNTSDPNDRPITPGRLQHVIWASNPAAGAVTAADGSAFARHLANTRGALQLDFGASSSCDNACGPSGPRRYDVAKASCLGNGWTPAEAAGDRDGGSARPRVTRAVMRNVTRLVAVNVTASPSGSGSGTPSGTPSPSGSGSRGASPSSTASGTPSATASGAVPPSGSVSPSPSGGPAGVSPTPSGSPSAALPGVDAAGRPAFASSDAAAAFRAAWATADVPHPRGGPLVPGLVFELAFATGGGGGGGYGAIGFNPTVGGGMVGADMVIAWVSPRTPGARACAGLSECSAWAGDYTSSGFRAPSLDTAAGGAADVTLVNASLDASGLARVSFSRPLATGDGGAGRDADLSPAGPNHALLWAVGPGTADPASGAVAMHTAAGATAAAFDVAALAGAGTPVVDDTAGAVRRATLVAVHGGCMIVAYWLCMTLGVALARYRGLSPALTAPVGTGIAGGAGAKAGSDAAGDGQPRRRSLVLSALACGGGKQAWFLAHVYLQAAALVLVAAGWIAALLSAGSARAFNAGGSWGSHERAGVAAVVLALVQGVAGGARPSPAHPRRWAWLAGHRACGACTLLLGSAAIFLGLAKWSPPGGGAGAAGLALGGLHVACCALFVAACEWAAAGRGGPAGCSWRSMHLVGAPAPLSSAPQPLTAVLRGSMRTAPHARGPSLPPVAGAAGSSAGNRADSDDTGEQHWGTDADACPFAASAPHVASPLPPGASSPHGPRLLSAWAGVSVSLVAALVAVLWAAAGRARAPGALAALADSHDDGHRRRLEVVAAGGSPLHAAAGSGRSLYETVWVNVTSQEWVNETVPVDAFPGGERDLCFLMSNFSLPARDTTYACRGFALPPGVALHATEFEMMVDRGDVAHHMVAFASWVDPSRPPAGMADLGGGVWDCSSSTPNVLGAVYVWAVGQEAMTLPPRVGMRVGPGVGVPPSSYSSSMTGIPFVFMQMHYNRPPTLTGTITDSSGFRMRVTDALRPIDAGLLWLGSAVSALPSVPTGREWFGVEASVTLPASLPPASALNPLTPSYTVFAHFRHMHTTGRRIWVEMLRGGVPVRDPASPAAHAWGADVAYNFELQAYVPSNASFTASDRLTTRCVFTNTRAYGALVGNSYAAGGLPVPGGESTSAEMCMVFALYYPRVPASTTLLSAATPFCEDLASGAPPSSPALPSCGGLPN